MTPEPAASPLDAALAYAQRGWRVLPIKPGHKRPPMDAWQHAATTNPDTIRQWWTGLYRDHGVGIATGPASGIFVLDVDNGANKNGDEALADLQATYGRLPDTHEVLTGSGGRHLYYRWPHGADIRNDQAGRLGRGLDIRGDGGQVVAPPTMHPNGRVYAVELSSPDELADPPDWLVDLLTAPDSTDQPIRQRAPRLTGDLPGDRYAASITWPELLEPLGATYLGSRLERTTGTRYELWSRPRLPGEDDFEPHTSATLYYKGSDVLKVFTSSWRGYDPDTGELLYQLTPDATYTRFGLYATLHHGGDMTAAARTLAAQQAAETPPEAPSSPVDGLDAPPAPEHPVAPFLVNYGDLWAKEAHAEDWLCEPLLARGRGHAMYAGAKTGKSLLVLNVAAHLATGQPVLNHPGGDPMRILYLDYEMTEDDLRERLETFGFGPDDGPALQANLHYALLPSLPPLDTAEGGQAIYTSARQLGVELVIIDTTARAVAGDENDADTYRGLYRHTGLWLKQAGIAYVRLDHAGKDVEKGQRGSSAKNDDVDVVWRMIRRDDQALRLTATHRRMSWVPQEVDIAIVEEPDRTRFTTGTGTWPEGTKAVADALDAAGAPLDISSRAAAVIVRDAGMKVRNAVIRAAIKHRNQALGTPSESGYEYPKSAPQNAGRGPGREARPEFGARWGATNKTPSPSPGAVRGALGRGTSDHRAPIVPPVGGHIGGGAPGTDPETDPEHVRNSWLIGDLA